MSGLLRCDVCHAKVNLEGLNRHKEMHERTVFKLKVKTGHTGDMDELPSPTYTPKFKIQPAKVSSSVHQGQNVANGNSQQGSGVKSEILQCVGMENIQKRSALKAFRPPTKDKTAESNHSQNAPTVNNKRGKVSSKVSKVDKTKKVANKKFKEKKVYSYFPGLANDLKINSIQNVRKQSPVPLNSAGNILQNNQLTITVVPRGMQKTVPDPEQNISLVPESSTQNISLVPESSTQNISLVTGPNQNISTVPGPKQSNNIALEYWKQTISVSAGPKQNISVVPGHNISVGSWPKQNIPMVPGFKQRMTTVHGPGQNISNLVPKQNVPMQPSHKQNIYPAESISQQLDPKVLKPGKTDCGECGGCRRSNNCEKCKFCLKPSLKKKCQLRTCITKMKHQNDLSQMDEFVVQEPFPVPLKSLPVLSKAKLVKNDKTKSVSYKPKASQQGLSSLTRPDGQISSKITEPRPPGSIDITSMAKKSTTPRESSETDKSFRCHKCDKSFVFPKWLINHMKKDSCRKTIKLKYCPICNKPIKSNYFNTHMKIHSVKMLKCNQCNCSFKNECTLAAHMKGVHAPRPNILVRCSECEKMFSNDRVLKQHVTKKHGEKTLSCEMCNAMFTTTNGLRKHKLSHTEIVTMLEKEKGNCDNKFRNDEDEDETEQQEDEFEHGDNETEYSSGDS